MKKEKTPYNPTSGDYDVDKLTDLHSSETDPSNYARNISQNSGKDSYSSGRRSENNSDTTERIPTLIKYSDMNKDDDEFEKKGEI